MGAQSEEYNPIEVQIQGTFGRMKVVSIGVFKWRNDTPEPVVLSQDFELSSFGFFQRNGVREMITFFCRTFVKRTEHGQRQSIQHEDYNVHIYLRSDGLAGVVVSDMEYPPRVAFVMISQMLQEFTGTHGGQWESITADSELVVPFIPKALEEYQDPAKADKLTKIQRDLDETTEVLHKTIDNVLERGVKLDDLVDKSNDLSNQSKMFYKQAKKTNSCCIIA